MSAMPGRTLADPQDLIADLQRQLAERTAERDEVLAERDKARWILAERTAERDEALEQQTATAEVLQVINSSPGDLAPVFDAVLDKATRLCEGDFGILWRFGNDSVWPEALYRVPPAFAEFWREPIRPGPETGTGRMLKGEGTFAVADAMKLPAYHAGEPQVRAIVDLAGARSMMIAPLRKGGTTLGAITTYRQEVRPFADKQIALLENFAAQAVIAMENARLITETREALEQQTATAEVLQVINASPGNLAPVFDAMLGRAIRLCEATHGHFFNYDGECFHLAAINDNARYVEWVGQHGAVRPHDNAPLGRINRGERIVHTVDMREEEVYRTVPKFREQIDLRGVRSQITLGLFKDNTLLGAMVLYRQEVRPFSEKQIALLQNFAAQAVIAMENARLLGELRARTEEVAAWNRELEDRVAAQLGELERVGKLKRFLAPQLAELIVASGEENILDTHRRDIVVVFCDLREFTAFAETAEPEEVLELLREYHGALGPIVGASEGTLDHFSGDGIMVFFNDPVPVPDASERAVRMAIEMRVAAGSLQAQWRRQGRAIGFGVGIARGYATLGQIGFADRIDYTAIGTVCNLAARLCAEAKDGQILISRRVAAAVEDMVHLEEIGDLALKGMMQAVMVYNVATEPQQSDTTERGTTA